MKRVILVGGGHAHLLVLRRLAKRTADDAEFVLVSPDRYAQYSGMVPGYLYGRYNESELTFDLAALSRAAGVRFIEAAATRVNAEGSIWLDDGQRLDATLISLDVGSVPAGLDLPGVRTHAIALRPMTRSGELRNRLATLAKSETPARVCVVGAGAGGVEVALAAALVLYAGRRKGGEPVTGKEGAGRPGGVTLIDSGDNILGEFPHEAREMILTLLRERGIPVRTGCQVAAVSESDIQLSSGEKLPSDLTVWLTGAAPPPVIVQSPLTRDDRGFALVDSRLRSVDGPALLGAGDCVTLRGHPETPKSGVVAVRAAPVLAHNLMALLDDTTPRRFEPPRRTLALLNTADGRALLRWGSLAARGRWVWWLKNGIDRRYVRKFQSLASSPPA